MTRETSSVFSGLALAINFYLPRLRRPKERPDQFNRMAIYVHRAPRDLAREQGGLSNLGTLRVGANGLLSAISGDV